MSATFKGLVHRGKILADEISESFGYRLISVFFAIETIYQSLKYDDTILFLAGNAILIYSLYLLVQRQHNLHILQPLRLSLAFIVSPHLLIKAYRYKEVTLAISGLFYSGPNIYFYFEDS